MTGGRGSGSAEVAAASLLWLLWAASAAPFFVLFFEFKCGDLGPCGTEWWYYARLYSHFFLYPVTFGLLSTLFLARPWRLSVRYLRSLPGRTRAWKVGTIAATMLAVVSFASYTELIGSTPAVWSFTPEALSDSDTGETAQALAVLERRCENGSDLDEREKNEFLNNLKELEGKPGSTSATEMFYRIGFVAMTTLFAVLFMTIFIARTSGPEGRRMVGLLAPALVFATFWVVMRITFLMEKSSLYPGDPLLRFNWLVFLVFVALWLYLVTTSRNGFERYERHLSVFLGIAGVVLGILGLFRDHGLGDWIPDMLVGTFGTGSSFLTYMAVLLFLVILFFPRILHALGDDSKPEDPD